MLRNKRKGEQNLFYRIITKGNGLADVYLTPGEAVPYWKLDGRVEFRFRLLAVCGVDPDDPQWGGDLEGHIREHYAQWLESAEEITI